MCPVARVESRSSISARTTSRSTSGPDPAACERTSDRCSWARISVGMCRVARAPNPVEMPYAGVGAAASSSTTARARSIAARASSVSTTPAPSRPTATTSSNDTGPVPTRTSVAVGLVETMRQSNSRATAPTSAPTAAESRIRDRRPSSVHEFGRLGHGIDERPVAQHGDLDPRADRVVEKASLQ